jgi:dihydrofolate reductase
VIAEVVPEDIMALKAQPGGDLAIGGADLAIGGADLAATFMRHDLIDEYRIHVHPVLLGRGNRLFRPSPAPVSLRLAETRAFSSGAVLLRYERPSG